MAKNKAGAVAEAPKAPRESRYETLTVRWLKGLEFPVEQALTAMAEANAGWIVKTRIAAKSGKATLQVDTEESAKSGGRGRPRRLISKETEQAAVKLLKAAMRDPEKAPKIQDFLERAAKGENVSDELSKLVGINA